jgi:hypothetical protein
MLVSLSLASNATASPWNSTTPKAEAEILYPSTLYKALERSSLQLFFEDNSDFQSRIKYDATHYSKLPKMCEIMYLTTRIINTIE